MKLCSSGLTSMEAVGFFHFLPSPSGLKKTLQSFCSAHKNISPSLAKQKLVTPPSGKRQLGRPDPEATSDLCRHSIEGE